MMTRSFLTVVLILFLAGCQCNGFLVAAGREDRSIHQRHQRSRLVQKHQQRFYKRLETRQATRQRLTRRFARFQPNQDHENSFSLLWKKGSLQGGSTEPRLLSSELNMRSPEPQQQHPQMQKQQPPLTELQMLASEERLEEEIANEKQHHEEEAAVEEKVESVLISEELTTQQEMDELEKNSQRGLIGVVAVLALVLTTALGKFGMLPASPLLVSSPGNSVPYTDAYLLHDAGLTLLTGGLGYAVAKSVTWAFENDYISSKDARKIIHTVSAPAFMLFWPFFSPAEGSFVFCALVPLINAFRLYLASTGQGESGLARAISRTGNLQEALGGPFIYVCIISAAILGFWRDSAAGLVAVCTMAVGDGLADLLGRRYGKSNPWPGLKKSVAGSVAFWLGSTVAIVGILLWMQNFGWLTTLDLPIADLWIRAAVIGFLTAALELVPIGDDNYTVPLAGAILGALLFPVS